MEYDGDQLHSYETGFGDYYPEVFGTAEYETGDFFSDIKARVAQAAKAAGSPTARPARDPRTAPKVSGDQYRQQLIRSGMTPEQADAQIQRAKQRVSDVEAEERKKTLSFGDVLGVVGGTFAPALSAIPGVGSALSALKSSPAFDIAKTGASFIPGVGQAVSGGLSQLAAVGQGASLADSALQAVRGALPPEARAGLDIAHGALAGRNVAPQVLGAIRQQLPSGLAQAAFDAGSAIGQGKAFDPGHLSGLRGMLPPELASSFDKIMAIYKTAKIPSPVQMPHLGAAQQQAAQRMQALGKQALQMPARILSQYTGDLFDTKTAMANWANRWSGSGYTYGPQNILDSESLAGFAEREGLPISTAEFESVPYTAAVASPHGIRLTLTQQFVQGLYDNGNANIRKAIMAHGLFSRLGQATAELDGKGGWTIKSGDTGYGIAKKLTGNGNRWKEILAVNSGMSTYTDSNGATQIKPWKIGQTISIPPSWLGSSAPAPAPVPTATQPATPAPTVVVNVPGQGTLTLPAAATPTATSAQTYTVVKGDSLSKIAQKLTGSSSRWTELYNENKSSIKDPNLIYPGQVFKLPASWVKASAPTVPTPNAPIPAPTPGPAVPASTTPTLGAIQAMLAYFYSKHGGEVPNGMFSSSAVPTFGTDPGDLDGQWDERSESATLGFQGWSNAHPRPDTPILAVDGDMNQQTLSALQAQNLADMQGQVVPTVPVPTSPTVPTTPQPSVVIPGLGTIPIPTVVPQLPPSVPASIPVPTTPAPAPTPVPQMQASIGEKKDNTLLYVALGAAALFALGGGGMFGAGAGETSGRGRAA